jgi:calpain-15
MFSNKEANAAGIYEINFIVNGERKSVVIDDFLPVYINPGYTNNGVTCFAHSNGGVEIWASLLEKAWAKLHGSYSIVTSGNPSEAFACLTEKMCESIDHDSTTKVDFWKQVVDGTHRSYLMSCSVNNSLSKEEKQGLSYHHAYALLSVHNEKDKDGNHLKLLQIRNPWGRGEWTGDWGDDSNLWYPELK